MNWAGRWAELIEVSNDKGPYKLVRVQSEGHEFTAMVVETSGVQASPLKDSQLLILGLNDDTGQATVLAIPPPAKRTDQQKEGEVTLTNHLRGQFIKMDDEGNIHIKPLPGKKVIIEGTDGGNVEIEHKGPQKHTGDREQTGAVTHTGNYTQTGVHTDSNGVHS